MVKPTKALAGGSAWHGQGSVLVQQAAAMAAYPAKSTIPAVPPESNINPWS
jgi:hypothetical protein